MKSRIILLATSVALLLMLGCSSPIENFYNQILSHEELAPYSGKTEVLRVSDIQDALWTMRKRGYVVIGESRFEGTGRITASMVEEQGEEVEADVALWTSDVTGTMQRSVNMPVYNPGQTTTTSAVVRTNTGQTAYGTARTQTSGTFSSTPVNYTQQVQEHTIFFLRKKKI